MARIHQWLILLGVVVAVYCRGTKPTCTVSNFQACRDKLPFDTDIPPENLTLTDFLMGCGNLTEFSDCVTGLQCTSKDEELYSHYQQFREAAEGYTYLCQQHDTRIVTEPTAKVEETCTVDNFQACRSKLPFNLTIPTENLTRSDFLQGCGNITEFSDCVTGLQCTSKDEELYPYYLKYLDTVEGYTYLCQPDTQIVFFNNTECLRAGFSYHNVDCDKTVNKLKSDKDRCRYIQDRAQCAFEGTLASCRDERVAQLVKTVIIKTHKRQYKAMDSCVVGNARPVEGAWFGLHFRNGVESTSVCGAVIISAVFLSTLLNSMRLPTGAAIW